MTYRIVRPWGRDRARRATLMSEHPTATDAFEAMERLAEQAQRTGGRINSHVHASQFWQVEAFSRHSPSEPDARTVERDLDIP